MMDLSEKLIHALKFNHFLTCQMLVCNLTHRHKGTLTGILLTYPLYTGGIFHCYMLEESIRHFIVSRVSFVHFFSSPEPKAPGELIGWEGSVVRRPSVRPSVHNFKRLLL